MKEWLETLIQYIVVGSILFGLTYYFNINDKIRKVWSKMNIYENTVKDCFYQNIKTKECEYILWKESHKRNCY